MASETYQRIYAVVRQVPAGRVATYGQVATMAGLAGHARQVGYALHSLDVDETVPWHRVINARGEVSPAANVTGGRTSSAIYSKKKGSSSIRTAGSI